MVLLGRPSARAAFALAFATLGCSAEADDASRPVTREEVATAASPIITGTASGAAQDAVVFIATFIGPTSYNACSGTLLGSNLVLTARHCVAQITQGPNGFTCDETGAVVTGQLSVTGDYPAGDVRVYVGATSPPPDASLKAKGIPATKIITNGAKGICSNDIALLVLASDVPNAKVASIRLDGAASVGDALTAVGFGVVESGSDGTRRQRAQIPVVRTGPAKASGLDTAVSTNEFEIGEAPCEGDSGGPAFDAKTGAVIGVVSRGGNGASELPAACMGARTRNIYTATPPFKALILGAYREAQAKPQLEPGSTATLPEADAGGCAVAPGGTRSSDPLRGALAVLAAAVVAWRRRAARAANRAA